MSTKSKRQSRSAAVSSGDINNESFDGDSFNSNASTLSHSRNEEKQYLSKLNDRLTTYINRVRALESENEILITRIKNIEVVETRQRESNNVEYQKALENLRLLNNDLTESNLQLDIELKKAKSEEAEAKNKLARAEDLQRKFKNESEKNKRRADNLEDENRNLRNENAQLTEDLLQLKGDFEKLSDAYDITKQQLEEEFRIRKITNDKMENALQDLAIARKQHDDDIQEVYSKCEVEVNQLKKKTERKAQENLKFRIGEMREDFDNRLREVRRENEIKRQNDLDDLNRKLQEKEDKLARLYEETKESRRGFSHQKEENASLKIEIESLKRRQDDLQSHITNLEAKLKVSEESNQTLKDQIYRAEKEFNDLWETKVQLDTELRTYNELLNSEEYRLKINEEPEEDVEEEHHVEQQSRQQSQHVSFADESARAHSFSTSSPRRGIKRRRFEEESYSRTDSTTRQQSSDELTVNAFTSGDVEIKEIDNEGKFIRLQNKSSEDVAIGGWKLTCRDTDFHVEFKFHTRQLVKGHSTVTVWSSNAEHSTGAGNLALKNQNWPIGEERRATLIDGFNDEIAVYERFHSERGEAEGENRCSIM